MRLEELPGNYHVKRGLEVAAVTVGVRTLLIGSPLSDARKFAQTGIAKMVGDLAYSPPCPCGYFEELDRECLCNKRGPAFKGHRRSFHTAGIRLRVACPLGEEIISDFVGEGEDAIRGRVYGAKKRLEGIPDTLCPEGKSLLIHANEQLGFHARGVREIVSVSRSIAAMDTSCRILPVHLLEAIQYHAYGQTK